MRRRGLLIPCLLLISLMLVLCMAQLGRQPFQYGAANQAAASLQARALAEAGLEDFRVKWTHDYAFPPEISTSLEKFTYLEEVRDFQTNELVGCFRLTIDGRWRNAPYQFLQVTSEGWVGSSDAPSTLFVIEGCFDIRPGARLGAGDNPRFGNWIEWREYAI